VTELRVARGRPELVSPAAGDGSTFPVAGRRRPWLPPIPRPEDRADPARNLRIVVWLVLIQLYLLFFAWYTANETYELWGGFLLAPILFLITAPFLRRGLEKVESDPVIRRLVILGLAAKLAAAFARYYAGEFLIGHADAVVYSVIGTDVATEFRSFIFDGPILEQFTSTGGPGTIFIRVFTAVIYTFVTPSITAGYVIYSFMSFWGLYFFYRAFSIAMPDGLRRRYVLLLFFLPSMVFWPSSIGKEAWMTMAIGLGAYGLARLIVYRRFGYVTIGIACLLMAVVRPHVAAIYVVGLASAVILRRTKGESSGAAKRIVALLVMAALAGILLNRLQSFFDLEEGLNIGQALEETTERSGTGGSEFTPVDPASPVGLLLAIVTVLFRPFLFEVRNLAAMFTALEGTFLIGLFVWNAARLLRLPAAIIKRPYVGFAVLYTVAFAFAFAAIANFGILARQRTQVFPIAVVMLSIPIEPVVQTRHGLQRAGRRDQRRSIGSDLSVGSDTSVGPDYRASVSQGVELEPTGAEGASTE